MIQRWQRLCSIGIFAFACALAAPSGTMAGSDSVDPAAFVRSDLVRERAGVFEVDHDSVCTMRDAAAKPSERARVRVSAKAPVDAISRDQFVALVQRMESVFLMGVGEAWRPGTTAMTMAQILDCRSRRSSSAEVDQEMRIAVSKDGFEATFVNRGTGTSSTHSETWVEAFRP